MEQPRKGGRIKFVGIAVDLESGEEIQTHSFLIYYSRTGVHVVPVNPKEVQT